MIQAAARSLAKIDWSAGEGVNLPAADGEPCARWHAHGFFRTMNPVRRSA
jgi:hypothetical protein